MYYVRPTCTLNYYVMYDFGPTIARTPEVIYPNTPYVLCIIMCWIPGSRSPQASDSLLLNLCICTYIFVTWFPYVLCNTLEL